MTAQIGDKFNFNGENYSIVAMSTPLRFNPRKYGIIPNSVCTACWAGYWCVYNVTDEGIFLNELYVNSFDDSYPEIEGISPEKDIDGESDLLYMGHHVYKNLNIKMNFSGKLLVGNGFISKYYIHMGFQRAWAYEVLTELVFDKGNLTEINDHSEMAASLRESIGKGRSFPPSFAPTKEFVSDSFSLKYGDKAWWLNK
jgi:hypothetical protein